MSQEPQGDEPPASRAPKGERSIDFGAHLMNEAKKKVRESERHPRRTERDLAAEAEKERLAALANPADALRESVVQRPTARVERPKPARRVRPLRTKLLVALLSCLTSLLLLEIGLRIFVKEPDQIRGKPLGPNAFAESLRFPVPGEAVLKPPYRSDPKIGYGLSPDYDGPQSFEEAPGGFYRLKTNDLGLRDERALVPKERGTLRILVVGDSMTFGLGVEREQAFPAVLEKQLGAELGRPLDVVNAGVTCWGQREEVAFLENRAPELAPDLVLLEFTVANDVLDNLRYFESANDLVPDPRLGADLAEHPLFEIPLAETSRAWRLFAWHIGRHIVRYRAMEEPMRLDRTRALLRRARDAATALHAKFGMVMAPTVVQVDDGFVEALLRTRRINDAIIEFAKEEGIPIYDPLPALKSAKAQSKVAYFPKDKHWNPVGHEIVGTGLASFLAPMVR